MILVTTPTGNTGRHVLQTLLSQGESVRILVRNSSQFKMAQYQPDQIFRGDLQNSEDLACALEGIEEAFFCIPQSATLENISSYYASFARPFAQACQQEGVQRIVMISGGDRRAGNHGPGLGLYEAEQIMAATGIAIRYVRCGYFMENLCYQIEPIVQRGFFALPFSGDVPLPFVAARDIGIVSAHLLADRAWSGQKGLAAHGLERISCNVAASIVSEVLGLPIQFQSISGEMYKNIISTHGGSEALGQSLVEMFASITAGRDMGDTSTPLVTCSTSLRQWVESIFKPTVDSYRSRSQSHD